MGLFRRSILFLLAVALGVWLFSCKKEKSAAEREQERKEALVAEMKGVYATQVDWEVVGGVAKDSVDFCAWAIFHWWESKQQLVFMRRGGARIRLEIGGVTAENIYMDFVEAKGGYSMWISGTEEWEIYKAGEPKFSGHIAVYDRRAKTFQLSLKERWIIKPKDGREREVDYNWECVAERVE